jgi:sulfonate transport system ATP-binding protein
MSVPDRKALAVPAAASSGGLLIRGLGKDYPLENRPLHVLDDISLAIRPGEFVSLVGPSGCGKSTLLRLIVGLDADFSGEILLDGVAVQGTSLDRGIVFQDHRLLPWFTVQQNVALALINRDLPGKRKQELVRKYIALVGLTGFENAYAHQLSGGMAQRAALARALVAEPKILLLDEPLGALDALTRIRLQHELQRIWMQRRVTVIMVTHDVEEAVYLSDRVVVMDSHPGRIRRVVSVPVAHPRDRSSPALKRIYESILQDLLAEPVARVPEQEQ